MTCAPQTGRARIASERSSPAALVRRMRTYGVVSVQDGAQCIKTRDNFYACKSTKCFGGCGKKPTTPWNGVTRSDYDFRSWVQVLPKQDRHALWLGMIYEYARESPKLRGLPAIKNQRRKAASEDEWLYQSFAGLTEGEAASGRWRIYAPLRELSKSRSSRPPSSPAPSPANSSPKTLLTNQRRNCWNGLGI
jgi:hypothetical protein